VFINKKIWLGVYWYPLKNRGYFVTWGELWFVFFNIIWRFCFDFHFQEGISTREKIHCVGATKILIFLSVFSPFHWNRYWICRQKLKNTHIFLINKYRVSHAWIKITSIMTENLDHSIIILFWFHPLKPNNGFPHSTSLFFFFTFPKLLKLMYMNSLSKHVSN